jgi:hypothetical protein
MGITTRKLGAALAASALLVGLGLASAAPANAAGTITWTYKTYQQCIASRSVNASYGYLPLNYCSGMWSTGTMTIVAWVYTSTTKGRIA